MTSYNTILQSVDYILEAVKVAVHLAFGFAPPVGLLIMHWHMHENGSCQTVFDNPTALVIVAVGWLALHSKALWSTIRRWDWELYISFAFIQFVFCGFLAVASLEGTVPC